MASLISRRWDVARDSISLSGDDIESETVKEALIYALKRVVETEWVDVPGTTAKECGNYRDHSLFGAKEYAKQVIEGFAKK